MRRKLEEGVAGWLKSGGGCVMQTEKITLSVMDES